MKTFATVAAIALLVACSSGAPRTQAPAPASAETIPEAAIGLAAGTALEQPEQSAIAFNDVDPGSSTPRPRPNDDFPPVIPHSVADIETITATDNACLDCHDRASAAEAEAPAIPDSHYRDLRNAPDESRETLARARSNCTACHVAQTDSPPLVAIRR